MLEIHLHILIADGLLRMQINFHLDISLNVSKTRKLLEMSSESIASMVKSFISSTNETASLDDVVPLIESRSGEVFVNWMDFETMERIDWCDGMLPDVSNYIIEVTSSE